MGGWMTEGWRQKRVIQSHAANQKGHKSHVRAQPGIGSAFQTFCSSIHLIIHSSVHPFIRSSVHPASLVLLMLTLSLSWLQELFLPPRLRAGCSVASRWRIFTRSLTLQLFFEGSTLFLVFFEQRRLTCSPARVLPLVDTKANWSDDD